MSQTKQAALPVIGFIGLGAMGGRMISQLSGAGELLVFDTDAERAQQAAQAASGHAISKLEELSAANIVILMLPNSAIVDDVFRGGTQKGLIDILPKGALVIDMSSSTPANTIENAKLASQRGLVFIDAPVSGGIGGAASGKLAIMVGGDRADFERARPFLERMGSNVILVGDVGAGHAVKALNNLLAATIFAATAEVFAVGEKFGLDPAVMHQVVNASSGGSFMTNIAWPKAVLQKTWDFGFALQLMNKDVGIAMSLIEATGTETILSKASAKMWAEALGSAPQGSDMTELAKQIQKGAGL